MCPERRPDSMELLKFTPKVQIYDNFMQEEDFCNLRDYMLSGDIPWYVSTKAFHVASIVYDELKENELDNWQLSNTLYENGVPTSSAYDAVLPLLNTIKPRAIIRVKANLNFRTKELVRYELHTDVGNYGENEFAGATTGIFYLNDNDGYTFFGTGEEVESKANRLVTFPVNTPHSGTSCTNVQNRVVLNLNYF